MAYEYTAISPREVLRAATEATPWQATLHQAALTTLLTSLVHDSVSTANTRGLGSSVMQVDAPVIAAGRFPAMGVFPATAIHFTRNACHDQRDSLDARTCTAESLLSFQTNAVCVFPEKLSVHDFVFLFSSLIDLQKCTHMSTQERRRWSTVPRMDLHRRTTA